jgi:phenylalanyl-tRNA synthetase beta chain
MLEPEGGAARMAGCILRAADNTRPTPLWMRERLRRCGLRSISAVVDVTNYVMLELGQPIHAYDLTKLQGGLNARRARIGERLKLLDGRELTLDEATLVIADEQKAVGLAGIMGGADTAIERGSRDIALEVGWFKPAAVAATARRLSISTDASQRFERGVDWAGQERALERARQLISEITGATAEPAALVQLVHELPQVTSVALRPKPLQRLLGCDVPAEQVEQRLRRLGMTVLRQASGWEVTPPSWRFDIGIEADLIEEVGRLGGLDAIPAADALLPMLPRALDSNTVREEVVMRTLAARGYYEAVNYAFVDPALQTQLFPEQPAIELANPLASDRAVMRVSLWPGLIGAARENLRRQADRIRLFEIAARFLPTSNGAAKRYREQKMLAGIALGARLPEQWGEKSSATDFYDVKEDLLCALHLRTGGGELVFSPAQLSCLHPGRSARISRDSEELGVIGELHPGLVQALDLTSAPILFELDYARAFHGRSPQFQEISRFPQIRRDLSLTLPKGVTFASVAERVTVAAPSSLKELRLFDIYQGEGVDSDRKSIAIGLILQDLSRTLTDEDADRVVAAVLGELQTTLDAKLRQ